MATTKSKVSFSIGATINIGDFESVRVDYGMETEVPDNVSVGDAMRKVEEFVEQMLENKVKEIRADAEAASGS
jgi:hypothetical protein